MRTALPLILAACVVACGCSKSNESKQSDPDRDRTPKAQPHPSPRPTPVAFAWDEAARAEAIEAGAAVIEKHQCNRCHEIDDLPKAARPDDCVSCHVFLKGLKPEMELYQRIAENNGKDILDRYINKIEHFMELPSLTGIAKRVSPEWIGTFLAEPHDLRPLLSESMIRNKLTADEIRSVVRYFAAVAESPDPYDDAYVKTKQSDKPDKVTLEAGKELFASRGCATCHVFGNTSFGFSADELQGVKAVAALAPNLRFARDRVRPEVLVDWILDPPSIKPGSKMPKMIQDRFEAELIADYIVHGDFGSLEEPPAVAELMKVPPAVDREVGWAEVKEEVLGHICVHCHMNDFEKDTGPGNKGGLGYTGIGLSFRTYERTVYGAIDPETGERYSVLVPREGETVAPVLDAMVRRRVENLRDTVPPLRDTTAVGFGEGRLGMPLGLPSMTDEQLGILRAWIEQGCPGPTEVTGRPDKDDGFLVPDGPIAKNTGCELREPAAKAPKWATRAQPEWQKKQREAKNK